MSGLLRACSRPVVGAMAVLVIAGSAAPRAGQQASGEPGADLRTTLERASARVEDFLLRAQSLVCTEKVYVQPLSADLSGNLGRSIESELRLSWDPGTDGDGGTDAVTLRRVIKVNGRPPRKNDRRNCTTEERNETSPQPLSMLLAGQREKYSYSVGKPARLDGRAALTLEFREIEKASGEVRVEEGDEDCLHYELNGGMRGRLWIDAETHDVLRLDQHLAYVSLTLSPLLLRRPGTLQDAMLERYDTSIRFKRLTFDDPAETLVLPVSYSTLLVTRGSVPVRTRTQTTYTNYQRFLTGGRIVPPQ